MKKLILIMSIFALFSCGSDSKKGGGGKLDLSAACEATTAEEFFAALAGSVDLTAIDTFVENSNPATTDTTFTDGDKYKVTFSSDKKVTIATNGDDQTFEFGDDDMFGAYDHEINVGMDREHANLLIQLPCGEDAGEPLFIAYSNPDNSFPTPVDGDFFWRLDAGAN